MSETKHLFIPLLAALSVPLAAFPAVAENRHFTILAVEPKGGTTADKEPFPSTPPPPGGGMLVSPPDAKTGRWEVSAYVFQPAQIVVSEGDQVTLEFVGINGATHPTTISAFGQTFTLKRGEVQRVTFKADKVGAFGIVCTTHQPTMRGELVVLPRQR